MVLVWYYLLGGYTAAPSGLYARLCHAFLVIIIFSARCNIYISRLCYDAILRLSLRLSVTFVYCGHRLRWIPDVFACLDRWMSLLLTDNASPGSLDGMMPGFLVEDGGGMEKLVVVVISLILLIFYRCTGNTWRCWVLQQNIIVDSRKCIMSEDGTTNYHIGLERRHIVHILRNGRRIKRGIKCVTEKCISYTQPCSVGIKCVTA